MATQADVRRMALALPGVVESKERFAFSVPHKGQKNVIAWVWKERVHPKKARVPNPDFLGVAVASLTDKDLILASDDRKFFTEPHYDGYPAVLVRLKEVTVSDLRPLIEDAWRCRAPKELLEPAKRKKKRAKSSARKLRAI